MKPSCETSPAKRSNPRNMKGGINSPWRAIPLPIVERELRVASRRAGTYWGRVGAALTALAFVGWGILMHTLGVRMGAGAGAVVFRTLAFVTLFGAAFKTLALTAPALAMEKREGTLGFLFLTDLKARDIVFGKLAATSLVAFFQFLAVVPALAVLLLLGGVTAGDVTQFALALINIMFLAAAVGLFASALSRDERNASGMATLLFIMVLGATPVLSLLGLWQGAPQSLVNAGFIASPGFACVPLTDPRQLAFWGSMLSGQVCAWGLLWLTCWLLPRVWQDRPATASQEQRQAGWKTVAQGTSGERLALRRWLLAVNPILWLTARHRSQRWTPWIFLALMAAIAVWLQLQFDAPLLAPPVALAGSWLIHAIFKVWVVSQAAQALSADRDRGALELLLSTPLTTREILRGHWLGLRWVLGAPLVVAVAAEVLWLALGLASGAYGPNGMWVVAGLANFLMLGADLWAAGWVGLWQGVRARNSQEAAGRTQWRIMMLPWGGVVVLQAVWALSPAGSFLTMLAGWVLFGLAADAFFGLRARRKLLHELRAAAVRRAAGEVGSAGWITRIIRWLGQTGTRNA